jgi:hypothetical protein
VLSVDVLRRKQGPNTMARLLVVISVASASWVICAHQLPTRSRILRWEAGSFSATLRASLGVLLRLRPTRMHKLYTSSGNSGSVRLRNHCFRMAAGRYTSLDSILYPLLLSNRFTCSLRASWSADFRNMPSVKSAPMSCMLLIISTSR